MFEVVFPDADDAPVFGEEEFFGGSVAGDVAGDFCVPIFLVGGGHAAVFGAAMPEAAVHEDSESLFGEDEIRTARDGGVAAPACEAGGAEEGDEDQFGGFVAAGTDGGHDAGAFGLGEGVSHEASMRRIWKVGEFSRGGDCPD